MKTLSIPLCVLTLLAAPTPNPVSAQDWLQSAIPAHARSHDFGTVARAAKTEHRFTITNNSQQTLHIMAVRASCGCTTPIIENDTIPPGQTGAILARFNTGSFTGQKQATVTVTFDRPFRTELQLNVRGYIRSDVVLDPGEAAFGQVPEGEEKTLEMALDYAGRGDWKIERLESPLPFLDLQFEEVSRVGGRIQYKILAKLADNAPTGFLQSQLVMHTNDRRLTTLPIQFSADIQPSIQFSPQILDLGKVKPNEPIKQRLVIKGRKPFRVLKIESDVAEVRFPPVEEPKLAHLLDLTIAPLSGGTAGKVDSQVRLLTDLQDEPLTLKLAYELVTQTTIPTATRAPANQAIK